jgi:hypothetical protein
MAGEIESPHASTTTAIAVLPAVDDSPSSSKQPNQGIVNSQDHLSPTRKVAASPRDVALANWPINLTSYKPAM